jgi:hypothetical protein
VSVRPNNRVSVFFISIIWFWVPVFTP